MESKSHKVALVVRKGLVKYFLIISTWVALQISRGGKVGLGKHPLIGCPKIFISSPLLEELNCNGFTKLANISKQLRLGDLFRN